MKNNISTSNKFYWIYLSAFFIILSLFLWAFPPYFFPPEWGKSIVFRVILSLILFLFAWQAIYEERFRQNIIEKYKNNKWAFWLLGALFLSLLLSTLFSSDVLFSLWASPHRSGGFFNFAFYILFAIILFFILEKTGWKKLLNFSFIIGAIVVLFATVQYYNLLPKIFISYETRPPSTLSTPSLLAIYLLFSIFLILPFVIKEKGKKKIFYSAALALFLFGIFLSGSRSTYLGIFAGLLFLLFTYPIKFKKAKIFALSAIILMVSGVLYINFGPGLPSFIQKNQQLSSFVERLSLKSAIEDLTQTRFSAWRNFAKAVGEKPIFGWGPESQSIAFDKYFDPSLSYLIKLTDNWWDRAHNIFLDLALSYGVIFLLIYLLIFIFLFWKLQKNKNPGNYPEIFPLQALFLAYFTNIILEFDSVSTYLMLFFIVGYSLHLAAQNNLEQNIIQNQKNLKNNAIKWKKPAAVCLFIILILFIWQYNLKPLIINAKINKAEDLSCNKKLSAFEKLFSQKSFLDSFLRLKYVDNIKFCESYITDNETDYIEKAIDALKYSAKIQPNYTRTWILLSRFNNTLMAAEPNPEIKKSLLKDSEDYLAKAQKLSPKRQEVLTSLAETYFVSENFKKMEEKMEQCLNLGTNFSSCYWYLGLSEILLGDEQEGEKSIELAKAKGYSYDNRTSYSQLAIVYTKTENYEKLIPVYSSLINIDKENIQYRATLAFIYKKIGDYKNARQTALKILEITPEAKDEVNEFLRTLPY